MNKLKNLGLSEWFASKLASHMTQQHEAARVSSVHKGHYIITNGELEVAAELSGSMYYRVVSSLDLPTTGDWVYADFHGENSRAIIQEIIERKTLLKRKTAGKQVEFQLIAANIDVAFIVQSLNQDLNLRRLERYLVMVRESKITPVILLSKSDLSTRAEIDVIKEGLQKIAPQVEAIAFSNIDGDNLDAVRAVLKPTQTYCLLGSSGVGKTALLNSLLGVEQFEVGEIRAKDDKGRHTTTSRELTQLEGGALIIDTPGMRELGNMSIDDGLDETFAEILELAQFCKFSDCAHEGESGCAVRGAIEDGELTQGRYDNYLKMTKEAKFNQMSYSEKRAKDKDFGKMIKSVMKHKKHKR